MTLENDVRWEEMEPTPNRQMSRIISILNGVAPFLREHGHVDEAIEVLNALSWGDETYECGVYAYELGLCYEAKGDLREALRFFEIADRENPGFSVRLAALERIKARLKLE